MPVDEAGFAADIRVCGDDLLGVRLETTEQCQHVAEALRHSSVWLEAVGGIDSVVVQFDATAIEIRKAIAILSAQLLAVGDSVRPTAAAIEVPVCYGGDFGPDFDRVCKSLGLSSAELVNLHTSVTCNVDMMGFTPGFAYVGGLPDALNVPRLSRPRLRVDAGSVGIADGRSGLYALPGPGGWSLIGQTPLKLFDAAKDEPFLLRPGLQLQFRSIGADEFEQVRRQ